MKKISRYSLLLFSIVCACTVPNFDDINPKPLKDSPAFNVTPSGTGQATSAGVTYVLYGQSADFTLSVTDAPGKVDSFGGTIAIPSYGDVTVDQASLAALKGMEKGSGKVSFKAMSAPDGTDRAVNLELFVSDGQVDEKGVAAAKTTKITKAISLVACVSDGITAATYKVTAASGNQDGGTAFTLASLEAAKGGPINVIVTKVRPGLYAFSDATGGVWPVYYSTRAIPALSVDLCNTTIKGHEGAVTTGAGTTAQRKFTLNGTLNSDGTITIIWSYIRETGGSTPTNPANGSYTLTKI